MPSHIALRGLPIENLKRKPFRTGALLAVVTILALTFFGGTMLTMNLNTGMTSMEKRLGADLMVVPQNTVQKAEALLTNGNPSTFYFTKDIADEVMQADGIAQATEQTYISSLAAACCAKASAWRSCHTCQSRRSSPSMPAAADCCTTCCKRA